MPATIRATVVLPVPGLPTKTRWRVMVAFFRPALVRSASTRRMAVWRWISDFTPARPVSSSNSASHSSTVFAGSAGSASAAGVASAAVAAWPVASAAPAAGSIPGAVEGPSADGWTGATSPGRPGTGIGMPPSPGKAPGEWASILLTSSSRDWLSPSRDSTWDRIAGACRRNSCWAGSVDGSLTGPDAGPAAGGVGAPGTCAAAARLAAPRAAGDGSPRVAAAWQTSANARA